MAKCDLCGNTCAAQDMEQLLTTYQVAGVTDVCPDCSKWATKLKGEMLGEVAPRMRHAITQRHHGADPYRATDSLRLRVRTLLRRALGAVL